MQTLGVTSIGRADTSQLLAGEFPRVTSPAVASAAGGTIKTGTLVTGNAAAITPVAGANSNVYGIAAEDIEPGNTGVVWLTGEFVGPRVTVANNTTWTSYVDKCREKSIFLKGALAS